MAVILTKDIHVPVVWDFLLYHTHTNCTHAKSLKTNMNVPVSDKCHEYAHPEHRQLYMHGYVNRCRTVYNVIYL